MINKSFKLVELFDYQQLQKDLDETVIKSKNLEHDDFVPVPEAIKNLMNFSLITHIELIAKYPDDDYLKFLGSDEGVEVMLSTNWYEKYGVTFKN